MAFLLNERQEGNLDVARNLWNIPDAEDGASARVGFRWNGTVWQYYDIFGADVVCLCDIFTLISFSCDTHTHTHEDVAHSGTVQSQFIP